MVNIAISLIGANGDTISLGTTTAESSYILASNVAGFGLTGLSVNIVEGAGDGGKYLGTRKVSRDVDLPIVTVGADRAEMETKLRRLGRLLSNTNGPTRIMATYTDGTAYYLDGYLITGGDITYGTEGTHTYAKWAIQLRCPQPYWVSTTPTITTLTGTEITNVSLVNNGDIDTPVILDITGATTTVQFSNINGFILYEDAILSTDTITIDCGNATVVDNAGINKYGSLGPVPKMITIPRGTSTLNISGTGIDTGAIVVITYYERKELIF